MLNHPTGLFSGDYNSALRGCWPLKFLHTLQLPRMYFKSYLGRRASSCWALSHISSFNSNPKCILQMQIAFNHVGRRRNGLDLRQHSSRVAIWPTTLFEKKQESPADAVTPARRKSMQKLLQFDVFCFISPNSISPNCQCIASRGRPMFSQALGLYSCTQFEIRCLPIIKFLVQIAST